MARKGLLKMSYIIGSQCVGCIETDCIEVCPVECIHYTTEMDEGLDAVDIRESSDFIPPPQSEGGADLPGPHHDHGTFAGKQLFIDPNTCIECGACEPACPVEAIFDEEAGIPGGEEPFVKANYAFFGQDPPSGVEDVDLPQGFEAQLNA